MIRNRTGNPCEKMNSIRPPSPKTGSERIADDDADSEAEGRAAGCRRATSSARIVMQAAARENTSGHVDVPISVSGANCSCSQTRDRTVIFSKETSDRAGGQDAKNPSRRQLELEACVWPSKRPQSQHRSSFNIGPCLVIAV